MTTLPDRTPFFERGPLVPFVLNLADERMLWVGDQAEERFGHPRTDWLEPGFWQAIVVEEDRAQARDARAGVAASGAPLSVDYRIRDRDGGTRWVTEAGSVVQTSDGPLLYGHLIDITERKLREVSLWRKEEQTRALLRNAPDALILTDAFGRIVDMNAQAEELFQYRLAEVAGSSMDPLVPERLQGRLADLRGAFERDPNRRTLVDGQSFAIEQRDGTEVPVEIGMSFVAGSEREGRILNSFRDLTARLRVEAQLRSSERRLQQIANVLPALVAIVDTARNLRFVNDAYAEWYGRERRQVEGRPIRDFLGARLYGKLEASIDAALEGTASHFRGEITGAEDRTAPVDISLVPQFDDDMRVDGFLMVLFDASGEVAAREAERKHRDELAHVARVATLGELAASIAHELNQPLSAVVANAHAARRFLQKDPPELEEIDRALLDVAEDGRRAGEVIASMRQLLQRGEARREDFELYALVRAAVDLLRSEAVARGVDLRFEPMDSRRCQVRGDAAQIKQVLLNLMKNGIEAALRLPGPPRTVLVELVESENGRCRVRVEDNGPGFGDDDIEELFQPFVTRRPGGLGMGLPISRTISEAHGGSLRGEPGSESGSVFTLVLPCA